MIEATQTIARSRLRSKPCSRSGTPKHYCPCCQQASRTIDQVRLDAPCHIHALDRVTRIEHISLAGERGSTDQLLLVFGSKLGLALGFLEACARLICECRWTEIESSTSLTMISQNRGSITCSTSRVRWHPNTVSGQPAGQ